MGPATSHRWGPAGCWVKGAPVYVWNWIVIKQNRKKGCTKEKVKKKRLIWAFMCLANEKKKLPQKGNLIFYIMFRVKIKHNYYKMEKNYESS